MGLDCTAHEFIEKLPDHEYVDECWDKGHLVFRESMFPASEGSMTLGCYATSGDSMGWRAGSYSGYSGWRDKLSQTMLGVPARDVWLSPDGYGPFVELINFSDCEGVIGPDVCAKLAADFDAHRDKVPPAPESKEWNEDAWFAELYETWSAAFHLAAGTGCIVFH